MIFIHPPCLTELIDDYILRKDVKKSILDNSEHLQLVIRRVSMYKCPFCNITTSPTEIKGVVNFYTLLSYEFKKSEEMKNLVLAFNNIQEDFVVMKGMSVDDQLRYQLRIYKEYLFGG